MDETDSASGIVESVSIRNTFYEFDLRWHRTRRLTMHAPNGHARLAVLPETDHMARMRRSAWLVPMISACLNAAMPNLRIVESAPYDVR